MIRSVHIIFCTHKTRESTVNDNMKIKEELAEIADDAHKMSDDEWLAKYGKRGYEEALAGAAKKWALEMLPEEPKANTEWAAGASDTLHLVKRNIEESTK